MRLHVRLIIIAIASAVIMAACGDSGPASGKGSYRPIDNRNAVFWDRQTTESAELLRQLAGEFNRDWTGLPIKVERSGTYADIFRKVTAGLRAGTLPAMAVSYESMTMEYIPAKAVINLDPLIADEAHGFDATDLDDFFPVVLETNRFPAYGNAMYSFPFAKSVLMLYYNKALLARAGIHEPPSTWDAFLEQCRAVKALTGKYAHAVSADCSTLNGMIFSMGGEVMRGRENLYDSAEALAVFTLYETLAREELAYLIPPGSYEDNMALARDEIAFVLRSSSGLSDVMLLMEGDKDRWALGQIPQADPAKPATVLYGPNVCLFNTTEDQIQAAWAFVRYFTRPDVSARWSVETGYLPVRRSAMEHPVILAFWNEWEHNRAPYDSLAFARPEPSFPGWQQVRDLAARAVTEIMTGVRDASSAAAALKRDADRALSQAAAADARP